jgi:predicted dehydrogenase
VQYQAVLEGDEREKAWRFQKSVSGGGVVIDGGSHTIRPIRMLMKSCGDITVCAQQIAR